MMRALARFTLAPALAALVVAAFEIGRTALFGSTALGAGVIGLAAAVLGLLALPLWLLGAFGVGATDLVRTGWRWGRQPNYPPHPSRVAAWLVYGTVALAGVTFGTQMVAIWALKAFNQAVYKGLAAGLVAAAIVVLFAILSGPLVGALDRVVHAIGRRLPDPISPLTPGGGALWVVLCLGAGAILAPIIIKPLHTVDLRPARMALFWGMALAGCAAWVGRPGPRRRQVLVGAGLAVVFVGCFAWTAGALGESQRLNLAVARDTILTAPVLGRLSKLGDRDGDGASRWFGGGDCDDDDPAIRPGVYDHPDDGLDQNCTGADLVLAEDPIGQPPRPPSSTRKAWNVIVLTIDALRDDAARDHMPRLQALADAHIDFRNAYSHGASTYWSMPALFTSTLPSRLEMGRDQTPVASMKMLTEVMRDHGWHTSLFANVTVFFVRGLRQGTHTADYKVSDLTVHGAKPGSTAMTDRLLGHIDRFQDGALKPKRSRFFAWAHYYDPHDPYFEVPGYPADDNSDRARYDAIVRYVDAELGRLFDGLTERGLWDDTLILITSDHGDEFLDHGHRFHGRTLYEEMVHVPLVLKVPGLGHQAISTPVGQMEIAPTMLELMGLPVPNDWVGRSRASEVRGEGPAELQPVYFEVFPDRNYDVHQVGMRLGDLKLIYRVDQHFFELYDLAADPLERDNVYDEHPEAPALRAQLMTYLDHQLWHLAQGKLPANRPVGAPEPKKKKKKRKPAPKKAAPKKAAPKKAAPKKAAPKKTAPKQAAPLQPTQPEALGAAAPAPASAKPTPAKAQPARPAARPKAPARPPARGPTRDAADALRRAPPGANP